MSRFASFASVAVLAASLAPFAAQARSGDIGTTGPATHAVQSSQHGAFVPGRGADNAHFAAVNTGNVQLASNQASSNAHGVSAVSPDSVGG